ncbi:LysR substrate-binding domain-containing protein [Cupriavidus sp. PET2-C1]
MRLSQLQDFIAVAECGSIRAGAKERRVSAPGLTKSIRQLEEELHVPLLTRTTRGVMLSAYGEAFLRRARLIAAEARNASDEMAQMLGSRSGIVRVGATSAPAQLLLPSVLKRFRAMHPDVLVSIESGVYPAHVADLRAGVMDMAISPIPAEGLEREFSSEDLYNNDSVVVAHHEHPLRHARTLRELAGTEWVLTGRRMEGPGAAIMDAFRDHGLPLPRVAVRCDTIGVIQALLADRTLLCLLPRQLVATGPHAKGMAILPIEDKLPSHTVSLIYRAEAPMTPVATQFATLLRREVHYLNSIADSPLQRVGCAPVQA